MENTTASTRETLLKDVDALKRNVIQLAQDVHDRAEVHAGETKDQVTGAARYAMQQVKSYPFAVLGVGIALGFLFGFCRSSKA